MRYYDNRTPRLCDFGGADSYLKLAEKYGEDFFENNEKAHHLFLAYAL
jgi:hypothetical protein